MSSLPVIRPVLLSGLISMGLCFNAPVYAADEAAGITWDSCRICHEAPANAAIPPLAGRDAGELLAGLMKNQDGQTIMHRFTAGLSPDELEALAQYISALESAAP